MDNPTPTEKLACSCEMTLAFFCLRGWLGVRALLTGLEKYGKVTDIEKALIDPATGQPDASGVMVTVQEKVYALANYAAMPKALGDKIAAEPLLPKFAMAPFMAVLGPLLILSGLMLLAGIASRTALAIMGLLWIVLSVGLILINQNDGVAWLGIHTALTAFALVLVKHNKLALWPKF